MTTTQLGAPFPYHGGKARYAPLVWERFGPVDVYVEPFAGSIAVGLGNPYPIPKREIISDTDGMIVNFWRAVQQDPDQTAHWADNPTLHHDLTARHGWLKKWKKEHSIRLMEDPDYYDVKVAGWWVWGISIWIGGGWCSADWESRPYADCRLGGKGISAQRLTGLKDKRPLTKDSVSGAGISAQRQDLIDIRATFRVLSDRLKGIITLNRSWEAALTSTMLADTPSCADYRRAVFMDPPYLTAARHNTIYDSDFDGSSDDTANASWEWAKQHGERHKIAYACHDGDFDLPAGWDKAVMSFKGVWRKDKNTKQDCVMFSPACRSAAQTDLFS